MHSERLTFRSNSPTRSLRSDTMTERELGLMAILQHLEVVLGGRLGMYTVSSVRD